MDDAMVTMGLAITVHQMEFAERVAEWSGVGPANLSAQDLYPALDMLGWDRDLAPMLLWRARFQDRMTRATRFASRLNRELEQFSRSDLQAAYRARVRLTSRMTKPEMVLAISDFAYPALTWERWLKNAAARQVAA